MNSPEGLTRRQFLTRVVGGVAAVMVLDACGLDITAPKTDAERLQWANLSPTERLKKLIEGDYPKTFNVEREVTIATAQAYCEQTKCNFSPDKIAEEIRYLGKDEYVDEKYRFLLGVFVDPVEAKAEAKRLAESTVAFTNNAGKIFMNKPVLEDSVEYMFLHQSNIKKVDKRYIKILLQISTLSHELTHANFLLNEQKESPVELSEDVFRIKDQPVTFDILNGFVLEGKDLQGTSYLVYGGGEGVLDLAARIIVERIGIQYLNTSDLYYDGASMVDRLNQAAGIQNEEFLRYATGELPSTQLLEKWGSLKKDPNAENFEEGVRVLGALGLYIEGRANFENMRDYVYEGLNVSFE